MVPQGGSMSPTLFNLVLDYWLMMDPLTKQLIKSEQIIAFADDIAIIIKPEDVNLIPKVFQVLHDFGFTLNYSKCKYIGHEANPVLSKHAEFCESVRFLGIEIWKTKQITIESIKNSIMKNLKKLKAWFRSWRKSSQALLTAAFYRSLLLFHSAPSILVGELKPEDLKKIDLTCYRRYSMIPAIVPTYMSQVLDNSELSWSWALNKIKNIRSKLALIQSISSEMSSCTNVNGYAYLSRCFLDISQFLDKTSFHLRRLILKSTWNSFFEFDSNKEFHVVCNWGYIWDSNHRVMWTDINIMRLAFLSFQNISSMFIGDKLDEDLYLEEWNKVSKQILDIKMIKISENTPRDTRACREITLVDIPQDFKSIYSDLLKTNNTYSIKEGQ